MKFNIFYRHSEPEFNDYLTKNQFWCEILDYEEITDNLIQETMKEFKLGKVYQEFLDSLIQFNDFKNVSKKDFKEYIDEME